MLIKVRLATIDDAAVLYRWDKKPHVQAAVSDSGTSSFDADWEDELAPRDDGTLFLIAEADGVPFGAMQIIDPQTERSHYWGDSPPNLRALDIWIGEETYLGQGLGSRLMTVAINHCFSDPSVVAILIDPLKKNRRAHRFYKRFGFTFLERRQFDEESDCFVFQLTRSEWDLKRCEFLYDTEVSI